MKWTHGHVVTTGHYVHLTNHEFPQRREDMRKLTRHHRKPKSLGGTAEKQNISKVPLKKHRAWHILFANWPPERIVSEINRYFIDPAYRVVIERRSP